MKKKNIKEIYYSFRKIQELKPLAVTVKRQTKSEQ